MRERKKPTHPWVEKSKNEIENADKLLAERIEQVRENRPIDAFRDGYEAGFAKACEMLRDFAEMVYQMMEAQHDEAIMNARLTYKVNSGVKIEEDEYAKHNDMILRVYQCESQVRNWIKENYPHLMEEDNANR